MSSQISFAQMQDLVLTRLKQDKSQLPASEWNKVRYILGPTWRKLSINELIIEVERGTAIGRQYVLDEAKNLGYTIVG